jgi:hypothetical protein
MCEKNKKAGPKNVTCDPKCIARVQETRPRGAQGAKGVMGAKGELRPKELRGSKYVCVYALYSW